MDLSSLEAPILEDEVWETIKSLPADRTPDPDDYTGRLYKSCWTVIKADFMATILTLQHADSRKLWLLNSADLILIPKKDEDVTAKDFHPISCIHSFAKLIAKIMANRLAPLLNSLVATNQSAFIHERCIHDNFMLVLSGSCTPGTTGCRLWPNILDMTGSPIDKTARKPYTPYQVCPHHSWLERKGHPPKKN
jgi:hypothetical protein